MDSYEMVVGRDYYVVDSENQRMLVIFDIGRDTETYAYYYPDARLADMVYYYEEDFDVVNTFDVALEDFYDKVGTLSEIVDGRYVMLDEAYQESLFENYFKRLLDFEAVATTEGDVVSLEFMASAELTEAYVRFAPFDADALTAFELVLEVNEADQTVVAYENYATEDQAATITREFAEAFEPVPMRGEVPYLLAEDFDEIVLDLGLPLY